MTEFQILTESILNALVAGLLMGAIYGLMCVGLAMIFGIMKVINFAQGDFMMMGMFVALFFFSTFTQQLVGDFVGPYIAVTLAAPIMFAVGYLVHMALISRVTGSRTAKLDGEGHYAQLILTLGLSLILQNGAMMLLGPYMVTIATPLSSSAWMITPIWDDMLLIFINKARGVAAVISVLVIIAIGLMITRSRLGKSLRAAADNPEASTYMGIDVNNAHRIAFALGIAITAVAGGLLATNYPFQPFVGLEFVIIMYAGVVLGGIGSIIGPFWGGMTIGIIQQMSTLVLPFQLQNSAIFVLFLLVVILRPQGLFGRVSERT